MLNKKLSKFVAVGAALLVLTSCGDIVAKPSNYEDGKILDNIQLEDKGSEMNNMLSTIYDAMHDTSTLSSTTIDIVNEQLFNHYFGNYQSIKEAYDAYKAGDDTKIKALINDHKGYQELNDKGEHVENSFNKEVLRVERVLTRIETQISEKIYNTLSSSEYQNIDGLFSEELFALNIYKKLHILDPEKACVTWDEFCGAYDFYDPILLVPNTDLYDEDTGVWNDLGIIHISSVTDIAGNNKASNFGYYSEYINAELLPSIYQHILGEYYLYTNEYSSLGSKYAREATYIALTPNSKTEYSTKHLDLIDTFARTNILSGQSDLEVLQNAWLGYDLDDDAIALLEVSGFNKVTVNVDTDLPGLIDEANDEFKEKYQNLIYVDGSTIKMDYYEGTLFGNIIEDFQEINPNDIKNSSAAQENKFSGNNTYSYYEGLVKEINALLQKNFIVEDWGLKSDGFTGLDTTIKERLMSINVATDLKDDVDVATYSSNYLKAVASGDEVNFYLLPEKRMPNDEIPFVLSSGTTRYIVQVTEAASIAKLSKKANDDIRYSDEKAEEVAYEICNILADNSTTKSNAMEFFLEESKILYHDDKILEYFQENYPNLFENK